jgi:hypothetical protein
MKSMFASSEERMRESKEDSSDLRVPESFAGCAQRFLQCVTEQLDKNEIRSLATDKVASPLLQVSALSHTFPIAAE